MSWLSTGAKEIWSLFVDDGQLAALTLAWLGIVAIGAHLVGGGGVILLAAIWPLGLVLILIEGVARAARKRAMPKDGSE